MSGENEILKLRLPKYLISHFEIVRFEDEDNVLHIYFEEKRDQGSCTKPGDYVKSLVNLNRKKVRSLTPRSCILKFLILALKDSAAALVLLWSK